MTNNVSAMLCYYRNYPVIWFVVSDTLSDVMDKGVNEAITVSHSLSSFRARWAHVSTKTTETYLIFQKTFDTKTKSIQHL